LTLASAAAAFTGFARWSFAFASGQSDVVQPIYHPQFFSPTQQQTIEALAELILPATYDAAQKLMLGAKAAGVAEFIDFMAFNDPALQGPFRDGLQWLDQAEAAPFLSLPAETQRAILERLAYREKHRKSEKEGQQFFQLMRRYTVMGFYTTRIGLESLDYPGLTFYSTSPGCTHPDNPEHVGL
jgi:gluconate 2-dehydrogenase gamma chain